ncbi:MAG: ABC transporter ATP-binding protein [Proteobacteria bacterium]|nr:ABC transporter ATP-binding protein [Pseudomonadota bacterium]MBI3497054.1 ABC transporter ATP-binding protein [Pseudomonadota bacterium]
MQIIAESISHRYDGLEVLDGIAFRVEEGEILAVIGPSGCGKSTLLGILGGLIQPSFGRVSLAGDLSPSCLNPLTYVFQDFALLPWRTVWGNVALALEHHGLTAEMRRRRIESVLALTGLAGFAEAFPKQLSGGMRQRVGIARALAVEPAVLLLDEPLSALDAQTRELLLEEFIQICEQKRTTSVYVTHNLDEALRLADRVMVLSRRPGRIKAVIPVERTRRDRRTDAGSRHLASLRQHLWALIQNEARDAEREVIPP